MRDVRPGMTPIMQLANSVERIISMNLDALQLWPLRSVWLNSESCHIHFMACFFVLWH